MQRSPKAGIQGLGGADSCLLWIPAPYRVRGRLYAGTTGIELVSRLTVKYQHCLEHFKLAHYLAEQAFSREGLIGVGI